MYEFGRFCVVCVHETKNLIYLKSRSTFDINTNYSDMIQCVCPNLLILDDLLPQLICQQCRTQLKDAYFFHQKCFKSVLTLKSYISTLNIDKTSSSNSNFPANGIKRKLDMTSGYNEQTSRKMFFKIKRLKFFDEQYVYTSESNSFSSIHIEEDSEINLRSNSLDFGSEATTVLLQSRINIVEPGNVSENLDQNILDNTASNVKVDQSILERNIMAEIAAFCEECSDKSDSSDDNISYKSGTSNVESSTLDSSNIQSTSDNESNVTNNNVCDNNDLDCSKNDLNINEEVQIKQELIDKYLENNTDGHVSSANKTVDNILQILNTSTEEEIQKLIEANSYEISLKEDMFSSKLSSKKSETQDNNIAVTESSTTELSSNILQTSEESFQKYIQSNCYEISLNDIEEESITKQKEETSKSTKTKKLNILDTSEERLQKYIEENAYEISLSQTSSSKEEVSSNKNEDQDINSEVLLNFEESNSSTPTSKSAMKTGKKRKKKFVSEDEPNRPLSAQSSFSFNYSQPDSLNSSEYISDTDIDYLYSELYDLDHSGIQENTETNDAQNSENANVKLELDILEPTSLDYTHLDLITIKEEKENIDTTQKILVSEKSESKINVNNSKSKTSSNLDVNILAQTDIKKQKTHTQVPLKKSSHLTNENNPSKKEIKSKNKDTLTNLDLNINKAQLQLKNTSNLTNIGSSNLEQNILEPIPNIQKISTIVTSSSACKKMEMNILETSFVNNIVISPTINFESSNKTSKYYNSSSTNVVISSINKSNLINCNSGAKINNQPNINMKNSVSKTNTTSKKYNSGPKNVSQDTSTNIINCNKIEQQITNNSCPKNVEKVNTDSKTSNRGIKNVEKIKSNVNEKTDTKNVSSSLETTSSTTQREIPKEVNSESKTVPSKELKQNSNLNKTGNINSIADVTKLNQNTSGSSTVYPEIIKQQLTENDKKLKQENSNSMEYQDNSDNTICLIDKNSGSKPMNSDQIDQQNTSTNLVSQNVKKCDTDLNPQTTDSVQSTSSSQNLETNKNKSETHASYVCNTTEKVLNPNNENEEKISKILENHTSKDSDVSENWTDRMRKILATKMLKTTAQKLSNTTSGSKSVETTKQIPENNKIDLPEFKTVPVKSSGPETTENTSIKTEVPNYETNNNLKAEESLPSEKTKVLKRSTSDKSSSTKTSENNIDNTIIDLTDNSTSSTKNVLKTENNQPIASSTSGTKSVVTTTQKNSGPEQVSSAQTNPVASTSSYSGSKNTESNEYLCTICQKMLHTKYGYDQHMYEKHEEKTYSCKQCPQTFGRKSSYLKHLVFHEKRNSRHRFRSPDLPPRRPPLLRSPDSFEYLAPIPDRFRTTDYMSPHSENLRPCDSYYPPNEDCFGTPEYRLPPTDMFETTGYGPDDRRFRNSGLSPKCRNCFTVFDNFWDFKYHIYICNKRMYNY